MGCCIQRNDVLYIAQQQYARSELLLQNTETCHVHKIYGIF